jgi:pSer/pThr/pTyr-binding forkhead associated (FHA) protein
MVDDPSVESIHARLVRVGETYRISDDGSVAGTWVNYTPVSNEGTRLEHGDLVHIGTAGYRFTLYQPSRVLKTIISSEDSSR